CRHQGSGQHVRPGGTEKGILRARRRDRRRPAPNLSLYFPGRLWFCRQYDGLHGQHVWQYDVGLAELAVETITVQGTIRAWRTKSSCAARSFTANTAFPQKSASSADV